MDDYGYQGGGSIPPVQYYRTPPRRMNGMGTAALIMSMLAVISVFTGIGPVFFGGLAIVFAVLSKGKEHRMKGAAIGSVLVSSLAIVAGIAFLVSTLYLMENDPKVRAQADRSFEMMYGVDYDGFKEGMQHYYETGEMPDFMKNVPGGTDPYSYPGGMQL